nr:MAG TPA: DNA-binding transcriptional regulator [Caudoviricetes sp.]
MRDQQMYKPEVIEYFGTLEKVATALGISVSAVSQWGTIIPEKNAYRLQEITKGQLKVQHSLYRPQK